MNSSIYIAENSRDMFNIDIPSFEAGDVSTHVETPANNNLPSEMDVVANKSFISFGVMAISIVFLILVALVIKKKKQPEEYIEPLPRRNVEKYQQNEKTYSENVVENTENRYSEYRPSSSKRTSLSTPTSINKCIRAFLENTKEN